MMIDKEALKQLVKQEEAKIASLYKALCNECKVSF